MPTLPNMGIVTPTLGGDSGAWDDKLNAALALLDAHDHTSGKGARVPTSGISINADLAFGGYAATGFGSIEFNAVAALAAGSKRLFVNNSDNELYWRTNAGTNVKLTSGTSINTTLVGGIVGDYSTVGAEVAFDDANDRYTFKQQGSPKTWARMASGEVRIFETSTSESVYIGLAAPAALGASYTATFPTALPGSTALMQISSAGQISFSNTTTGTIVAGDFRYTGSVGITLPASLILDRLGDHTKATGGTSLATNRLTISTSTNPLVWPLSVRSGDRITGYNVLFQKNTNNTNTVTTRLYMTDGTSGTETALGAGVSNSLNAPGFTNNEEAGLTIDIVEDNQYYLVFTPGGGVTPAADVLYNALLSISRP